MTLSAPPPLPACLPACRGPPPASLSLPRLHTSERVWLPPGRLAVGWHPLKAVPTVCTLLPHCSTADTALYRDVMRWT